MYQRVSSDRLATATNGSPDRLLFCSSMPVVVFSDP
jgi:hypothetical protein